MAAKHLEMPASQGEISVLSLGVDGCGCVISRLPPASFLSKGNGLLRGGEEAKLSLQVLLGGLTCVFPSNSDNDLIQ